MRMLLDAIGSWYCYLLIGGECCDSTGSEC
jgi:hypothetical protein